MRRRSAFPNWSWVAIRGALMTMLIPKVESHPMSDRRLCETTKVLIARNSCPSRMTPSRNTTMRQTGLLRRTAWRPIGPPAEPIVLAEGHGRHDHQLHLFLWTSSATLLVDRGGPELERRHGSGRLNVRNRGGNPIGIVYLNEK